MDGMVDMEMDADRQLDAVSMLDGSKPDYPYGLRISLTHDDLAKLGLDPEDARAGGMFTFSAKARITDVSHSEHEGQDKSSRIEAQITHLCIDDADEG